MKTVFIALGFHLQNTKSSLFFIDILKQNIKDLYIVSENDAWYEIPRIKPENIIIWQAIFTPEEIDSWKAKTVTIIPMYDACPHTLDFWGKYKKYKIFCFSKTLYNFLKGNDFNTFYCQYYIEPNKEIKINKKDSYNVFYWERSNKINRELVSKLLGNLSINNIHYHYSTNIKQKNNNFPTDEEIKKFNINFSDWFETQDEYIEILKKSDIYIAPREYEGIGLSFIEAMSYGCMVIAYDQPTMNEYIKNNVNGILFTDKQEPILLSNEGIYDLRINSYNEVKSGWKQWCNSIPDIIEFIESPLINYSPKRKYLLYTYKRLRTRIRKIFYFFKNKLN